MTQLAEPKDATSASLPSVGHWIGGHPVAGRSGRRGPGVRPGHGVAGEVGRLRLGRGAGRGRGRGQGGVPGLARDLALEADRDPVQDPEPRRHHRRDIAALLTAEHGKVPSDALGEIARGLENLEFACGVPHLLKGGFSEQASTGVDVYQIRQPLGVVAGITPFNFPAMVPMWMFGNAIACGNTFILKPSEKDPSASMFIAELLREAGVPEGVFSVVQGDKVAVDAILEHPDIAAVSFVGSTPIARYIYETGTRNGKRVQALGGAKNHMLVLPDADVEMAADAAVSAGYGSSGERCMAIATVVAVGDVADPARRRHRRSGCRRSRSAPAPTRRPRWARWSRSSTATRWPRTSTARRSRARRWSPTAASIRCIAARGYFLGACLIDNVEPGMDAYRDEIFGPVLTVVRVGSYEEALQLINDNPYGNGTAIFTRDGGAARQFQFDVNVGMVGINVPVPVPVAYYSFGGWKSSLFGDLNMYGPEGIQFYTRSKVVTSRWPDPGTSSVDLGFPRTR